MNNKNNIIKLLLNDDNVNDYTKLYIILYYKNIKNEHYIPNQLIMKRLNLDKSNAKRLIMVFKKKKIIRLYYKGSKRFFEFIEEEKEKEKERIYIPIPEEIMEYDWLNEEN